MKLTDTHFHVLICDDSKYAKGQKATKMICGVFASRKEANACAKEIKDCFCKHSIKRCTVTVEY